MRKTCIVANFKLNLVKAEIEQYISTFKQLVGSASGSETVLCPSYPYLSIVKGGIAGTDIQIGAQNIAEHSQGAFTGEVSAEMLSDIGCGYVIIGHSERRTIFNESDKIISAKLNKALSANLIPIICVGETLDQRENGNAESVVTTQLKNSLAGKNTNELQTVIIAYEPIWAIGTGKTATKEDAQSIHLVIRKFLAENFSETLAEQTRILYGGSVKPNNCAELMEQSHVDGLLVGSASLDPKSFSQIVNFNNKL